MYDHVNDKFPGQFSTINTLAKSDDALSAALNDYEELRTWEGLISMRSGRKFPVTGSVRRWSNTRESSAYRSTVEHELPELTVHFFTSAIGESRHLVQEAVKLAGLSYFKRIRCRAVGKVQVTPPLPK